MYSDIWKRSSYPLINYLFSYLDMQLIEIDVFPENENAFWLY